VRSYNHSRFFVIDRCWGIGMRNPDEQRGLPPGLTRLDSAIYDAYSLA